jgi:uncharacterized protein
MEFEWDEKKARSNLAKHGVSFRAAQIVFNDPNVYEEPDDFSKEGEERWKAIGLADMRLLAIIYAMRGETLRIISARRATKTEQHGYHNQ